MFVVILDDLVWSSCVPCVIRMCCDRLGLCVRMVMVMLVVIACQAHTAPCHAHPARAGAHESGR